MFPIDISKVPFSRYGSYLAVSKDPRNPGDDRIYIKCLHGNIAQRNIFEIRTEKPAKVKVEPHLLTIQTDDGDINIYMKGSDEIVLFGSCRKFTLSYQNAGQTGYMIVLKESEAVRVLDRDSMLFGLLQMAKGTARLDTRWTPRPDGKNSLRLMCDYADIEVDGTQGFALTYRVQMEEGLPVKDLFIDTDLDVAKIKAEYEEWAARFGRYQPKYQDAAELMQYAIWSAAVYPSGYFKRDAILMSNNWMCSLWCWDNCFNSMALAPYAPKLAFEQIMIPFDCQSETGKIPDRIEDRFCQDLYTKPPAMGWAYKIMCERGYRADDETKRYLRERMIRVLEWWKLFRDDDGDGLCQYNHGNESGWDNSTACDQGLPISSPDLTAFILLDYKVISHLSTELGDSKTAEEYEDLFGELYERFISKQFENGRPVVKLCTTGEAVPNRSALPYGALVLGEYLPKDLAASLAEQISEEFLDNFGLATEAMDSEKFAPGAHYWRGPSWPSLNFQVSDGLRRAGHRGLAQEIARRMCDAVVIQKAAHENYNANTGEGYDDPCYTWMASSFILFADEYFKAD
jgi:putative isomerase